MKAYKITLLFIDFDEVGKDEAKYLIESARLPNHVNPGTVMSIEEADIGAWDDDHPLNSRATQAQAFAEIFPAVPTRTQRDAPSSAPLSAAYQAKR